MPLQELLQRLEMTEGHYQRLALDHERETNYNREQQKRETQLQKQLRTVKNLTVSSLLQSRRKHGEKLIDLVRIGMLLWLCYSTVTG